MASNITAQSVLEEISQGHLECPICSERFKQPKLLECSHSFCLECLQKLRQNSPSTTKLSCPVCRKETLLRANGIDGLTTDYKSNSLLEAIEKQETQLKQQQENQVPRQEFVSKCSKHTDKDLVLYCNKCQKLICITCITTNHIMHPVIDLNAALDKSKQHATELLEKLRQSIKTFNIAIQEIDMSRKTLDSKFAVTNEKISKKADEEIARIREEKQKLIQEAEQIYKDRVKTMETARATNSKKMNKAEIKQDEVNQLMDQGNKIVHHIEQLLQHLKEYSEMESKKVPDGLTYMDFKESQNSLGRLMLEVKWTLKTELKTTFSLQGVSVYSNNGIVVLNTNSNISYISAVMAQSNPHFSLIQKLKIKGLTRPSRVTVNKNDELIVLDGGTIKIFNRNYQLLLQFNTGRLSDNKPACIAVDDNNLIAVGYPKKAQISLHKPDGSLIRTMPAPGIGGYLATYKQRVIYTNRADRKLVSVDYNGEVVFSVDINQSDGRPCGVCCDKDDGMYVAVKISDNSILMASRGEIHHYSPDGKYIGCIIKDCVDPSDLTVTQADDLVLTTFSSVKIYQHE